MTKAVEPYTDEELAVFSTALAEDENDFCCEMGGVVLGQQTTVLVRIGRLLATIEAGREKLAEKDALIAELEGQKSFTQDVSAFLGDKWVEERNMRHGAYASTKDAIARAEAAKARVSELEKERDALRASRDTIMQQAEGIAGHIQKHWPLAASDQRHLDENTPERAYWHIGRVSALQDVLRLIPTPPEEEAK